MLTDIDYAKRAKDASLNVYFIAEGTREGESRCQTVTPANPCCNSYSVAKAFSVTALGLAVDRGLVTPETRVYDILPDLFPSDFDPKCSVPLFVLLLKDSKKFRFRYQFRCCRFS